MVEIMRDRVLNAEIGQSNQSRDLNKGLSLLLELTNLGNFEGHCSICSVLKLNQLSRMALALLHLDSGGNLFRAMLPAPNIQPTLRDYTHQLSVGYKAEF